MRHKWIPLVAVGLFLTASGFGSPGSASAAPIVAAPVGVFACPLLPDPLPTPPPQNPPSPQATDTAGGAWDNLAKALAALNAHKENHATLVEDPDVYNEDNWKDDLKRLRRAYTDAVRAAAAAQRAAAGG